MNRLLLAAVVALAIHLVLLLTFIPQQKVFAPEIEGSGQITISINQAPLPENEDVRDPDLQDVPVLAAAEIKETIAEPPVSIENETPLPLHDAEEIIDEPEKKNPHEKASVPAVAAIPEETSSVAEEGRQPPLQEQIPSGKKRDDASSTVAEQEILHDPEPIDHRNAPPKYPPLARKRGWEGTVILEVDIQSNGMVRDIMVKQSSSFSLLDREALETVKKWHFRPGSKNGRFMDMKVLVPVHFILQEQ